MDISDLYTIGKVQNNVAITLKDNDSFSQTAYRHMARQKL